MTINQIEQRFKEISNLHDVDLSKSLIKKSDCPIQQVKTRKDKSKEFGEVFTPLFLVDIMILMKFKDITPKTKTCDLCAGYGQFTIRLMRMLYNKFKIDVNDWLKNIHTLTEIQPESCAKLVYIFGPDINLYDGDSMMLEYSDENDSGILFFDEEAKKWYNNELVNELIHKNIVKNNLKLLTFIFENNMNIERLKKLNERLNEKKLKNEK